MAGSASPCIAPRPLPAPALSNSDTTIWQPSCAKPPHQDPCRSSKPNILAGPAAVLYSRRFGIDSWHPHEESARFIDQDNFRLCGKPGRVEPVSVKLLQKRLIPAAPRQTFPLPLRALPEYAQPAPIISRRGIENMYIHLVMRYPSVPRVMHNREAALHRLLQVAQIAQVRCPNRKIEIEA